MQLQPGLVAAVTATVDERDTAVALGSGDVDVLGTPRVLALAEQAAVAAVGGALPSEQTTVGTWAEVFHTAPSRVGARIAAQARLTAVDGSKLEFTVRITEGDREIARVEHRRAVVNRDRFA